MKKAAMNGRIYGLHVTVKLVYIALWPGPHGLMSSLKYRLGDGEVWESVVCLDGGVAGQSKTMDNRRSGPQVEVFPCRKYGAIQHTKLDHVT